MPVNYTNRKGQTYTLYKGQTKTGKPRYYFGRMSQGKREPVTELPPGFTISESVNGVVSLVKDRPSLIQPEEVAEILAAVKQHPEARRSRRLSGWTPTWLRGCSPRRNTTPTTRLCCASPSSIRRSDGSARSGCATGAVSTAG